ncbi:hypothetical protein C8034_v001317 [Colletotrichum sidae]|uniref:Uncharacterized protein n=1 Tax=Colletotrichum sidae TaxID=1347389 RepID=A0A4R8TES4_9PEZI|nr:hypothetical protein C8034_v001317 [Colletotrichum sidae]
MHPQLNASLDMQLENVVWHLDSRSHLPPISQQPAWVRLEPSNIDPFWMPGSQAPSAADCEVLRLINGGALPDLIRYRLRSKSWIPDMCLDPHRLTKLKGDPAYYSRHMGMNDYGAGSRLASDPDVKLVNAANPSRLSAAIQLGHHAQPPQAATKMAPAAPAYSSGAPFNKPASTASCGRRSDWISSLPSQPYTPSLPSRLGPRPAKPTSEGVQGADKKSTVLGHLQTTSTPKTLAKPSCLSMISAPAATSTGAAKSMSATKGPRTTTQTAV